jgi:carboxyl-terminal processing protease
MGIAIVLSVMLGLVVDSTKAESDNFYADIIRLDNVVTKVHQSYVEEIPSEKLVDKAIEGMMDVLDPHTSFFKRKQYEELKIHTQGKFGGLGIQIAIRDKVLTVMTPISGTPAARSGIQSGDQIIKIEGESTKGITIEEAVNKLRGEPGSEVTITVSREGEKESMDYTITREIIKIKAVPFAGVLDNGIGYLRLTSFSQDAGAEVEAALKKLLASEVNGIIFDLRQNPGGLLPQAKEVADKFLDKKSLIVSTRGRVRGQNKEFYATSNPVLPDDMPVVVLVNSASASASEIVAGAIQDWDRGIVMGDTTFGKGSVQSILPLDKNHHLKLTTAFYYTPSGRCINKPENDVRADRDEDDASDEQAGDATDDKQRKQEQNGSEDVTDDAQQAESDTTTFRTKGGRIVYGGGGIVPDTIVKEESYAPVMRSLLLKDAFFKFANSEYPKLKDHEVAIDENFQVGDEVMNDFYAFLDSIEFEYNTFSEMRFKEFKEYVGLTDSLSDSLAQRYEIPEWRKQEKQHLEHLSSSIDSLLEVEAERELSESQVEIRDAVRDALLVRELGQDNEVTYRNRLSEDMVVQEAIKLMANKKTYASLLAPTVASK